MKVVRAEDIRDKRVLIRAGLNVPLKEGKIVDDTRLKAALPTIKLCLEHAKQVVICGHIGRPKNEEDEFSTKQLVDYFAKELNTPVTFTKNIAQVPDMKCILLENTRFHKGEKKNDVELSEKLSRLADIFVLDAFADMHRAHSSTHGVSKFIPTFAGLLVQREVTMLERVLKPTHPFVAVLGFAKIGDKLPIVEKLLNSVDRLIFAGGIMFTFYKAANVEVGKSLVDEDSLPVVRKMLNKYSTKIQLPTDVVVADSIESTEYKVVPYNKIPEDKMGLDIGPVSTQSIIDTLSKADTIFWNGPVGVYEHHPYERGTVEIAKHLGTLHNTCIIGGGDTVAAVKLAGVTEKLSHVSTGGGAALLFLSGDQLPGLQVVGYYD